MKTQNTLLTSMPAIHTICSAADAQVGLTMPIQEALLQETDAAKQAEMEAVIQEQKDASAAVVYAIVAHAFGLCIQELHKTSTLEDVLGRGAPLEARLVALIAVAMLSHGLDMTLEECDDEVLLCLYKMRPLLWEDNRKTDKVALSMLYSAFAYSAQRLLAQNFYARMSLTEKFFYDDLFIEDEEADTLVEVAMIASRYASEAEGL